MTEPQTDGKLRGACECSPDPYPLFILDEQRSPIPCDDVERWDAFMAREENTRIGLTRINGVTIITEFIGFRHPAPINSQLDAFFFETRIERGFFGSELIGAQTIRGAQLAHERAVEVVNNFRFIPALIQDALRFLHMGTTHARFRVARIVRALLS